MASATANQLTEDSCCAYCLQRLPYMVDPRQLPCSHVFCLSCLKADSAEISATRCRICRKTHEIEDLDTLAVADDTTTGEDQSTKLLTKVLCDVCTRHRSISTTYCCDCKKHYCEEHHKMHDLILGSDHEMVSNTSYESITPTCQEHTEEVLTLACSSCHETFCRSCDTEFGCYSPGDAHDVIQLQELATVLRQKMHEELKKFSADIAKDCKVEKSIWCSMDEVETKVEKMKCEVDRVAKQKISRIQRRSEAMKGYLSRYLVEVSSETEDHSAHLMSNIEHNQNLWRSLYQVGHASDLELIQRHSESLECLETHTSNKALRTRNYPQTTLAAMDELKYMRDPVVSHSVCPESVEFLDMCEGVFHSVLWNNDGNLIAGGKQLSLLSRNLAELDSCPVIGGPVTTIAQYNNMGASAKSGSTRYLVCTRDGSKICGRIYSSMLEGKNIIFHKSTSAAGFPKLAIHPQSGQIITWISSSAKLTAHTPQGRQDFEIAVSHCPSGIHFLSDGTLLVSFSALHSVCRYHLNNVAKALHKIWECKSLKKPTGVSSDSAEHIYVGSESSCEITILSSAGHLLQKLTLKGHGFSMIREVDISGTRMALACDDGLYLFDLYRPQKEEFDLNPYPKDKRLQM